MSNLNKDLLTISVEGFAKSTPTQVQFDESLVYSEEGWKGALAGFLSTGSTIVGAKIVGTIAAGPLGAVALGLTAGAILRGNQAAKVIAARKDVLAVTERIAQLRNKQYEQAKKEGVSLPSQNKGFSREDKTVIALNAFLGGISAVFGPITQLSHLLVGGMFGDAEENLKKELEKKMQVLRIEFAKIGYDVPLDY